MSIYRIIIVALIASANASVAMAQIYKCDGPDGPIYTDQECSPGAATVEVSESAGLSGISEEEKSELAEKKSDRNQARNRSNDSPVIENQNAAELAVYNNSRRVRERNQLQDRINSGVPGNTPQQLPSRKGNRRN